MRLITSKDRGEEKDRDRRAGKQKDYYYSANFRMLRKVSYISLSIKGFLLAAFDSDLSYKNSLPYIRDRN